MGQPFGHPTVRKIEVRTIATVCQSCRLIASYSLFRGCSGFDTRHRLLPSTVSGSTVLFDWLKCDAEGCPFRVPFFVNFDRDLSLEEKARVVTNWIWQDLVCMSGHRIYKPASLPGLSARRRPRSRESSYPSPKARLA
jgi:hypothetical protein